MAKKYLYKYARQGGQEVAAALAARQQTSDETSRPVRFSKHGCEDLRGAHVLATYKGRRLLGTVKRMEYDPFRGLYYLEVYHFCGDRWPMFPCVASFVRVLRREIEDLDRR